jgi:hypothetical protein
MNKKILIAPVEIAGYCLNLAKGFDQLKINYDFIKYENEINEYFYETKDPLLIFLAKKIMFM